MKNEISNDNNFLITSNDENNMNKNTEVRDEVRRVNIEKIYEITDKLRKLYV